MPIVTLQLPVVKRKNETRPKACPYCGGETFQRWGKAVKPVRDSLYRTIRVYRYRCCHCRRTFRHYPEGVDEADQTQRLRKLAAILWVLGMSLRGVRLALSAFRVELSHMSVWRDMQEQSAKLKKGRRWWRVHALGADGMYPLLGGRKRPVLIAVDLGSGQPVAIAQMDEANAQAVRRFLEPLVKQMGVSVLVSDDLQTFHLAAEKLGLEHQVCQFHVRRWVGRALGELRQTVPKEWVWVLEEVQSLISDLPPGGGRRLFELWKSIPEKRRGQSGKLSPLQKLRNLLIRLSENWNSFRVFDWQKNVPWTNNGTEQVIGRMQMRSRTVRGYKSWQGMQAALMLAGSGLNW